MEDAPDPRKYSILAPEKEDIQLIETTPIHEDDLRWGSILKYRDSHGRIFFNTKYPENNEPTLKKGPDQMLLTRLLKQFLPVADVIFIKSQDGGGFYSYQLPIENTKTEKTTDPETEIESVNYILQIIFGDNDHDPRDNHNIIINENGCFYFYDFESFEKNFLFDYIFYTRMDIFLISDFAKDNNNINFIKEKFNELLNNLSGESGLIFIKSIVEEIERESGHIPEIMKKIDTREFQAKIIYRLRCFKTAIEYI